jgi:hypothetical protein
MASILAIATSVLAAVVAIVAVLQWLVARNKLRLDLFDRRSKFTKRPKSSLTQLTVTPSM